MKECKLVVIDGHSLLYRAYHALPPLSSSHNEPVGAVYGFTNMLFKILEEQKPTHVAIAWDSPGPTFRHEEYAEYKATRVKTPEDFGSQKELTTEIADAFGIVQIGIEGFEADDIIGTLSLNASHMGFNVIIATGDMDALQLVTEKVSVLAPLHGFSQTTMYTPDKVIEKYNGLTAEQIVDFKALRGDPSDNIPGVKGIGEKSAIELLLKYKTLERVFESIEMVESKFKQKLINGRSDASLSKSLARIKTDMTLPVVLSDMVYGGFDPVKLRQVFADHDFTSLVKKLPANSDTNVVALESQKQFDFPADDIVSEVDRDEFDVKIAAHLLTGRVGRELDEEKLAEQYLHTVVSSTTVLTENNRRALESALVLLLRAEFEKPENTKLKKLFTEVEMPLRKVLIQMEKEGIKIDTRLLAQLTEEYQEKIIELEKRVYETVGYEFNLNSPRQLEEVLFDQLGLPVIKRTKTQRSTDESVLAKLKDMHPVVTYLLTYRSCHKILSTYLEPLASVRDERDRVHTTFNQTKTASGRLSSENPNIQNIPLDQNLGIRKLFIPEDGNMLIVADYSQIELRILAHVTKDRGLIASFTHGQDIHSATAARIFGCLITEVTAQKRQIGKTVNFSLLYGITPYGLSEQLDIDVKEAKRYIDNFFASYPGVVAWKDAHVRESQDRGYVETMFGRRRYLPGLSSRNNIERSASERIAINHPIQGTQADIIKMAMVEIAKSTDTTRLKMLIQVHDELVFEAPESSVEESLQKITTIMQSTVALSVPLRIEVRVGSNWAECK